MRTAELSIEINQPVAVVYKYAVDPDHISSWVTMDEAQATASADPLKVGSTFSVQRGGDRRRGTLVYELIALEPESAIAVKTAGRLLTYTAHRTFSGQNGKTTVMEVLEMEDPPGLSKLLAGFMLGRLKKLHQKNLQRLKTAVE